MEAHSLPKKMQMFGSFDDLVYISSLLFRYVDGQNHLDDLTKDIHNFFGFGKTMKSNWFKWLEEIVVTL